MTTAYDIEQAAFDSACDHAEETVEYIKDYADGVFDLRIPDEVARKILACRKACSKANEHSNDVQHNHYELIQEPLEQIVFE